MKRFWLYFVKLAFSVIFICSLTLKFMYFLEGRKGNRVFKEPSNGIQNLTMILCPFVGYNRSIDSFEDMPSIKDLVTVTLRSSSKPKQLELKNEREFVSSALAVSWNLVRCLVIRLPNFKYNHMVSECS